MSYCSPLESSVHLIYDDHDSVTPEDSKRGDHDLKMALMGIAFCLVAVGVVGLTTFVVLEMSRAGDGNYDDYGDAERKDSEDRSGAGASDSFGRESRDFSRTTPSWRTRPPRYTRRELHQSP
ncbi:uncharacterized protein LOC144134530 [Amblyomma americanum]